MRHRHYGDFLQVFTAAVVICSLAVTSTYTLFGLAAGLFGIVFMSISMLMQVRHWSGPLCEECIKAMPLNPAESAQSQRLSKWALRAFHSIHATNLRHLAATAAVCLWVLGCAPMYVLLGIDGAEAFADVCLSLGLVFNLATVWMLRTHNRLAPWCPYCDDDEDHDSSVPDPTGGRDEPVPA
ncbi:hypothetical protein [Streptomyces sp. NPDC096339]|uniref:hypothetical protein n=1 Tax=Streptomyces sp. NPDC096339 TaxID=3366086 RepID=UPI0037F23AF9